MLDKCGREPETYTGNRLESALVRSAGSEVINENYNGYLWWRD